MQHPDSLRLQAHFDGELDAMAAAEIEQHLQQCETCSGHLQVLESLRAGLRNDLPYQPAPAALRLGLGNLLDAQSVGESAGDSRGPSAVKGSSRHRWLTASFWLGGLTGGALVAACTAAIALIGWLPRAQPLQDQLVGAHVRSMMSNHPIDVVSSDHHTVKPWFSGHADVSPVVADFDAQGFRLVGGRADYLEHQRAAVMVYQHGAHTIDVFSWAAASHALVLSTGTRDGYHVNCWRSSDLNYCAVSDTGWDELRTLQGLLQNLSSQQGP